MIKWEQLAPGQYKAQVPGTCTLVVMQVQKSGLWWATVRGAETTTEAGQFETLTDAQKGAEIRACKIMLAGIDSLLENFKG